MKHDMHEFLHAWEYKQFQKIEEKDKQKLKAKEGVTLHIKS